jgi:ribosomal protein S27E
LATGPDSPQRAWRATCPHCGAPVEFASAATPVAVCSYCHSTLARDGDALRRIGEVAELFDDHTPLQLGASGRFQGEHFQLIGRLQLAYAEGRWTEWVALFDNGRRGWLSEDNGRYVLGFDAPPPAGLPSLEVFQPGGTQVLNGRPWQVASITQATVAAAEGELPAPPAAGEFTIVELRNADGEVGTLDLADPARPNWSVGRGVALNALALQGLRDRSEGQLGSRGLNCPNCGAALKIQLQATQSITCDSCASVVDVSQGVGGDLIHFKQAASKRKGPPPALPLGRTGTLALTGAPCPWQVVGYQERRSEPTGDDEDDEVETWSEYLLYSREDGFAFLVDAEDGWSSAVPITGAPQVSGDTAAWAGQRYRKRFRYRARTTWVEGEFYWRVTRDQRSVNTDYAAGTLRLNREQTGQEVTWSAGQTLSDREIVAAFGPLEADAKVRGGDGRAAATVSGKSSGNWPARFFVMLMIFVIIVAMIRACSSDRCDEIRSAYGSDSAEYRSCQRSSSSGSRSSGSSWGGSSGSSGSHK